MAWAAKVCQISRIEPIAGADKIETAYVGEWPCVVSKGKHHAGEVVVYIMQDSIVPDNILAAMGLTGKLAGPEKNRVKAIKLRGQRSVGLLVPAPSPSAIGEDVAERLGIVKYDPPIPIEMAGECSSLPPGFAKYDVDHWNTNPAAFEYGEHVIMLEKLHGANCSIYISQTDLQVCSRSYSLVESESNAFWRAFRSSGLNVNNIRAAMLNADIESIYLYGEVVPTQDLKYGHTDPTLYFYDMRTGLDWWDKSTALEFIRMNGGRTAPVLYSGPFLGKEQIEKCANGPEQVSGFNLHMREGVVISSGYGPDRKQYKYISFDFMAR
jgi:RNA ligase (TIGR02306 family)